MRLDLSERTLTNFDTFVNCLAIDFIYLISCRAFVEIVAERWAAAHRAVRTFRLQPERIFLLLAIGRVAILDQPVPTGRRALTVDLFHIKGRRIIRVYHLIILLCTAPCLAHTDKLDFRQVI